MQRPEHPVEPSGVEQSGDGITVLMWLAQFHAADDPKVREQVADRKCGIPWWAR
jgi:hypothetical protein